MTQGVNVGQSEVDQFTPRGIDILRRFLALNRRHNLNGERPAVVNHAAPC